MTMCIDHTSKHTIVIRYSPCWQALLLFLLHSKACPLYVDGACVWVCVQAEAAKNREQNLEEAKSITISEDSTLPPAKKVFIF